MWFKIWHQKQEQEVCQNICILTIWLKRSQSNPEILGGYQTN